MYKHILIATDGSELARKAVSHGLVLAKAMGSAVTIITVSEPVWIALPGDADVGFPYQEYERSVALSAAKVLSDAAEVAKELSVTSTGKHIKDQYPADAIVATAKEEACDLIVMGSHGRRGLAKLFLGSQATKVVTLSTVPVLIYR